MRVLFLENHDSFSWNVIDALPVNRSAVTIASGNARTFRQAQGDSTCVLGEFALTDFDCLIIGPGPTDPIRAGLVQFIHKAAGTHLPILGICLGHQAIGMAFGAQLVRTEPCHGKRSTVTFGPSRLLAGITGHHNVMRYHSLSLAQINSPLKVIAQTEDGIPMAIEHESLPIAGFQFHPDSYATTRGRDMIAAFFANLK